MFDRGVYKSIAKKQLKGRWTTPVLATLCIGVFGILCNMPGFIQNIRAIGSASPVFVFDVGRYGDGDIQVDLENFSQAGGGVSGLFSIVMFFAAGVLTLAYSYLFIVLSHTKERQPFDTFVKGFSLWLKGILGFLWYILWVFLWSLLFMIPGIVKAYAYSQMFFVMAEHPSVGVRKAMQISKVMTKGFKGDLFVMDLSFIGWAILAALTAGIGGLWLYPYMCMSRTNAYHALKARAIRAGDLTMEDFGETTVDHSSVEE